jgi:hypothetical protein
MLPMALDALLDVMTTTIDVDRLEKERAAVLSEASMVNKMEYRVECQILSSLHSENRISTRFPIGKENLIKAWNRDDLELYHFGDIESIIKTATDLLLSKLFEYFDPAEQIFNRFETIMNESVEIIDFNFKFIFKKQAKLELSKYIKCFSSIFNLV